MTYNITNGYSPRNYEDILEECVNAVNDEFGTSYTPQAFVGTNLWKFLYTTIQGLMTVENNIAELGVKMQDYIRTQNERLIIPTSSNDGIMQRLEEELNLISSVKPVELGEGGNVCIAVDVDDTAGDYEETKEKILKTFHKYLGAGLFYHGTESGLVTASNGQQFEYAYELPVNKPLMVKIDVTISDNTTRFIETPNVIKDKFFANFAKFYKLGYDFEPEIYLCRDDLPFASKIDISYSTDGGETYLRDILQNSYNEKITINPNDVIVEVQ